MTDQEKLKRETWEGGYVRVTSKGRPVFIIERWVNGHHYHVSTRCSRRDAALRQLTRFEAAPESYDPRGSAVPTAEPPLALDRKMVTKFRDWSIGEKGNSPKHANSMSAMLADWMEDLAGCDMRTVRLRLLRSSIEARAKSDKKRIIAIKSLYSWLRKVQGLLTAAQDPTLDLPVPQSRPEKWVRRKAVDLEVVKRVLAELEGDKNARFRDTLLLLSATAWHVSEIQRFARSGEIVENGRDGVLVVLVTKHKGGEPTRTPLQHQAPVDAARRIVERGHVPNPSDINAALEEAATRAGVPPFTAGVMRHSVLTWAIQAGGHIDLVSQFAGHKDRRTTQRFYVDAHHPTNVIPLPSLGA
jgi:integrase